MNIKFWNKKQTTPEVINFASKLDSVKAVFKEAYEGAIQLNESITLDNKQKQNEIDAIQAQIDFNNKVLSDSTNFVGKIGEILK